MLMTQCIVNVSGNNLLFVESPHMYKCCCWSIQVYLEKLVKVWIILLVVLGFYSVQCWLVPNIGCR